MLKYLRILLLPFSILFRILVGIRTWAYAQGILSSGEINIPVLSIGNLSTGGTGKTPLALWILKFYQEQGIRVAYLSRGYGRDTKGIYKVENLLEGAKKYGDEAVLVAARFPDIPCYVGENRLLAAQEIIHAHPTLQLLLLDDAFQHHRLKRELDIVLLDANRMPDTDFLLPAGNLREPISALHRAGMVVINKCESINPLKGRIQHPNLAYSRPVFTDMVLMENGEEKILRLEVALKRPFLVFAGLGNNSYFFSQIEQAGGVILHKWSFPDHHVFNPSELTEITDTWRRLSPSSPDLVILTTEKDFCRLNSINLRSFLAPYPWAFIRIDLEWLAGKDTLINCLQEVIHRK